MLGRKSYTQEEVDNGRSAIEAQLAAYEKLTTAITGRPFDIKVQAALEEFERLYFNNLTLVLDHHFVYRLRMVTGADGTPINEVEMISDSLLNNKGILHGLNTIKYSPSKSIVGLKIGDQIRLTAEEFERLSAGFFDELQAKFVNQLAAVR